MTQAHEHSNRDRQEHQAQDERGLRVVAFQQQVDRERHRLSDARKVAREGDGGAELTEGARPAQHGAGRKRWRDERYGHPPEHGPASGAERPRSVLVAPVHRAQSGLDRQDEERHGHERLRHHDSRGGERERDADRGEPRPDEAAPSECEQQRDAAHDRRQDHRQRRERAQQAAAWKLDARVDPRQRNAKHQRHDRRGNRCDHRQSQRVERYGRDQLARGVIPRRAREQARQRQDEERGSCGREHRDRDRDPLSPHAGRKPYPCRTACPCAESRSPMKPSAHARLRADFKTAAGYVATTFSLSGMRTPCTLTPAAVTSVTYTMPASASPSSILPTTDLTSVSRLFGVTGTPALARIWEAYLPAGTVGPAEM